MQSLVSLAKVVCVLTFGILFMANAGVVAQTRTNGKIAFTSGVQGTDALYTMNADGSGRTKITTDCYDNIYPRWSPDGTKIVFTGSCTEGNHQIYVMNADGSGRRRLTDIVGFNEGPTWSPDGTRIVFFSDRDHDGTHLFTINADGTNLKRLTTNPGANDVSPAWSPDGTRIAFSSNRNGNQNIYVMNADGSNQTRITTTTAGDAAPAWSPDGSRIIFTTLTHGNDDIYRVNPDGTNLVRLTTDSSHEIFPSWQQMFAPSFTPTLITESGTNRALAVDSVTLLRDPFPVINYFNFSADRLTRVALFAVYLELKAGESAATVKAQAEDSQKGIHQLPVEYVGKVPGFDWLTQINVELPEELSGVGDVMVSINLRGTTSNKVQLRLK